MRVRQLIVVSLALMVSGYGIFYFIFQKPSDEITAMEQMGVNTLYDATVNVDPDAKKVDVTMKIKTKNDTGTNLDSLVFNLNPKAYEEGYFDDPEAAKKRLGDIFEPGDMTIDELKLDGEEANYTIDGTILEITSNWEEDEVNTIELSFSLTLPRTLGRLSYNDSVLWLGGSFPIRAVYDGRDWDRNGFEWQGDPPYSEVGNYSVTITTPPSYEVASTGHVVKETNESGSTTLEVEANKVREFAYAVMSNKAFSVMEDEVDGITVKSWYKKSVPSETMNHLHQATVEAMAYFNKQFGTYPYQSFHSIHTDMKYAGMEYPGITFIGDSVYTEYGYYGLGTMVHELAHQWWYGVIGSNPQQDPWLDESLTTYTTHQFLEKDYTDLAGYERMQELEQLSKMEVLKEQGDVIGNAVNEFSTNESYAKVIYILGRNMFSKLEEAIGEKEMNSALREYYKRYQYDITNETGLLQTFEEIVGKESRIFLESWLQGDRVEYEK